MLQRNRASAMLNGDELHARWKTGEDLPHDELNELVLYLSMLNEKVDPSTAMGRLFVLMEQLPADWEGSQETCPVNSGAAPKTMLDFLQQLHGGGEQKTPRPGRKNDATKGRSADSW